MRLSSGPLGPVGPRGTVLLAAAGILGIGLAVHGWGARQLSPAGAGLGGTTAAVSPSQSAGATQGPQQAPSGQGSATTSPATGPAASAPGPLLSSQAYAPYAFAVWPGTLTPTAKTAETGLTISVRQKSGGISVTAGVAGQPTGAPHFYPGGARVYVIEAALGDDSGADYNLGDDGIVVTDSRGRILQ